MFGISKLILKACLRNEHLINLYLKQKLFDVVKKSFDSRITHSEKSKGVFKVSTSYYWYSVTE